ncbi:hypothetical protein Golob_004224 [Gossypium lobatum]|uniref:Uncharacterized protein n=1 Tax=Gossypium lobatum TaxID=34289 RepID=A0A7J8N115_9ROSI|nr:hypothetical protein [Gossypium lobatum]
MNLIQEKLYSKPSASSNNKTGEKKN